jgi:putative addiction module killer protein
MFEVRQTPAFASWLAELKDELAAKRIAQRLVRLEAGLFGDAKPVGGGVNELPIDHGPGYRVYFVRRGSTVIVILCGGDKRTHQRDIAMAKAVAEELDI